ncbi:hypothetical protein LZ017_05230 [Pelomonas sp. CA6]|uniref:hypothetical protein n=1 Tax=Pelomonas sp. CA6 TaxID=2907999 RepID=UPI001F4A6385|nr:hypothetical protein [Pelomonas sp. CA6]MCH7342781.1 hypothetical protein [Pelomonas sp. CA6]
MTECRAARWPGPKTSHEHRRPGRLLPVAPRGAPWAGALLAGLMATAAQADEPAFKLTAGHYDYGGYAGQDLNLRWRGEDREAWVGLYHDPQFGSQARAGADASINLTGWAQLQPSLQLASRGFVGGSVNLQLGTRWYGLLGWGRTNLKPYYNLNFDPNDAITVGLGWHEDDGRGLQLFVVADDRLHTGQRDTHVLLRWPLAEGQRLTLDLMHKRGQGDGGPVRAWGWSATWDWPRWFLRLARDPKQNFSTDDATRFSAGLRF